MKREHVNLVTLCSFMIPWSAVYLLMPVLDLRNSGLIASIVQLNRPKTENG
jgi:hypothetical protein